MWLPLSQSWNIALTCNTDFHVGSEARTYCRHLTKRTAAAIFSKRFVNAVAVGRPPVLVMAVSVMGIDCAGILATMRSRVLSSAVVWTGCRRMMRRASMLDRACINGGQRYQGAKNGQHSGDSFHELSTPSLRCTTRLYCSLIHRSLDVFQEIASIFTA